MDFKRIFKYFLLALVRPQSIFIFGSSCYLFKIVAPVYLTSALLIKERKKNRLLPWEYSYQHMTRTYVFEIMLITSNDFWRRFGLNLNIVILKKDTFKSNWSGCLLALYQQLQMIRFSLFVWYYGQALVIA
jgi:hypothetical protein